MRRFLLIISFIAINLMAYAAAPKWEEVNNPPAEVQIEVTETDSNNHTVVSNGYVYIYTSEPTTVKVFTILGQLISSEKVGAGTHRLKIHARGIYILKLGSTTRRITI